jgi:hypothetical protein
MRLSVALLILLAALAVAQIPAARSQGDLLRLSPAMLDGFYDLERSATLPGATGPLSREFRWTLPASGLRFWPALPASSLLEIEVLNPAQSERVELQLDDRLLAALPPTPALRTLRLLLPGDAATIELRQRGHVDSADRPLGLIVSAAHWSGLASNAWISWSAALGLPLTIGLICLLAWLAQSPPRWTLASGALTLGALAALGWRWPWTSRAIQPLLQGVLLCAIGGAATWRLDRRWRWAALHRWPRVIGAVWAISTLLAFTPTVGHDGVGYYAYLRSTLIDGDLRFANEFDPAQSPLSDIPRMGGPLHSTGYTANGWSVGPALYWAPFWMLAHGLVSLGAGLGLPWQADGYASPYITLIGLASALTGLLTMLGCFTLARRWWSPAIAALAAITVFLGSNLLFYAELEGSFAHSLSAATTAWFLVATLRLEDEPTWRRWLLLGLAAGAMIVTYWITALLLLAPLAVTLRLLWPHVRQANWRAVGRLAAQGCLAAAAALLVCAPQLLAWRVIFGSWLATPQGSSFITPDQLHLRDVLISPLYGLTWWTPAYAIGLLGGVWFALRRPWPGLALLGPILLYIVYNASLPEWFGNGGFGLRRLTPIAPVCALGLAAIFAALQRRPALAVALAAAIAGWGVQMTARYVVYDLPHDPYVLMDLHASDLLLTRQRLALAPLLAMARTSWLGRFVQGPSLGDTLTLALCLLLVCLLLCRPRSEAATRPTPTKQPRPTILP